MNWIRKWGRFLVWWATHDRNEMHRRAQAAEAALGRTMLALTETERRLRAERAAFARDRETYEALAFGRE